MEADERPSKKRRLSHDTPSDMPQASSTALSHGEHPAADVLANGPDRTIQEQKQDSLTAISVLDPEESTGKALPMPIVGAPFVETISDAPNGGQPMSKNQLKKLRKQQEWEAKKPQRKLLRKQKIAAKRERKREEGAHTPSNGGEPRVKEKAVQLPITFLIDCDFDDLMLDNERISLAGQITRSYSENRRARFRAHVAVCSFAGKLRHRFDNVLSHYKGWKGVRFLECDFVEAAELAKEWMSSSDDGGGGELLGAFANLSRPAAAAITTVDAESGREESVITKLRDDGEVVYLTSEGRETLTDLKPYSTYIIGGLVDKNREKGICYKRATARGVRTAKLPIGEFMDMSSRKVLATNHVNEIVLKWLECGDWGEAFSKVIPKRKGGKLKAPGNGDGTGARVTGDEEEEASVGADGAKPEHDDDDELRNEDEEEENDDDEGVGLTSEDGVL